MNYDNAKRSFVEHINRFVDKHRYPDFRLTDDVFNLFFEYSSFGKKVLTTEQIEKIEPLINGQKTKEITIKLVVQEMSEWWSNGWGWGYPLYHMIENETDPIMLKVWNRFIYLINKNGYCDFLEEFSGIDDRDKKKYIEKYLTGE